MATDTSPVSADDGSELRLRRTRLRAALPRAGGFDTRRFRTWVPDAGTLVEVVEPGTPQAGVPFPTDDSTPSTDRDE